MLSIHCSLNCSCNKYLVMYDHEDRFRLVLPLVQKSSVSKEFCCQDKKEQKQGLGEQIPDEIRIGIAGDYMQFIFQATSSTSWLPPYTNSTGHLLLFSAQVWVLRVKEIREIYSHCGGTPERVLLYRPEAGDGQGLCWN